jgi:hypothetical protein
MTGVSLINIYEQPLEPTVRVTPSPVEDSIGLVTVYVDVNLQDQDLSGYLYKPGIAGGQQAYGGVGATDHLTLSGTSHATKSTSYVIVQPGGGNTGIGLSAPSAALHVRAGAATAGGAPIKINPGTAMTVTEAGAIEFHNNHLYFTVVDGGPRYQLDQQTAHPAKTWVDKTALAGAYVINNLTVDSLGHPTDWTTRQLAAADIGAAAAARTLTLTQGTGITITNSGVASDLSANRAWTIACSLTGMPTGTEGQTLYNNNGTWTPHSGLFWDDTNSSLGIGTTTPGTHKLNVNGTANIATSLTVPTIKLTTSAVSGYYWKCTNADGTGSWASIASAMLYQGTWNASTNTPAISDGGAFSSGYWYRCTTAGTWNSIAFSAGDDVMYNGSIWQRIPAIGYTLVTASATVLGGIKIGTGLSIDGSGIVTATVGTVTSISTTGPITGGTITSTGTIGIQQANGSQDGYVTAANWSTFNAKEPGFAAGTTAQYFRGDKSWQTLNSAVVPESTNLYYTDARARAAIGLTTTGSAGAATYSSITGVLNIPSYTLAGFGGEPAIAAGTSAQYWRGDKTWQTLNTVSVAESTNLYFTNARARSAVSLTTTGSSGAATYNNGTGVFNIPNYTLAGLGAVSNSLAAGYILVGNASNIATAVAATGDVSISNTGAVTILSDAVTYGKMQDISAADGTGGALLGCDIGAVNKPIAALPPATIATILKYVGKSEYTAMGALLAGTGAGSVAVVPIVATTGYVLTYDSTVSTRMSWKAPVSSGTVTSVSSANTNLLTVSTGTTTPTLTVVTGTVANGGTSLSTSGQIYSFVTGQGYITSAASALLSATHTDTTAASVVTGDLIYGSSGTAKWTRLSIGTTAGHVLTVVSGVPQWAAPTAPSHTLVSHTASGLTTGTFLKATGSTTYGFAAHGLTYSDVGAAAASHTHTIRVSTDIVGAAQAGLSGDFGLYDIMIITEIAQNFTLSNTAGTTPPNGARLTVRIKDAGVSKTFTWGSGIRKFNSTMPTSTTAGKWMYFFLMYNSVTYNWDLYDYSIEQ